MEISKILSLRMLRIFNDLAQLQLQLCMLPDRIKTAFNSSIKQVANVFYKTSY